MEGREEFPSITITIAEAARMVHVGRNVVEDWIKRDSTFPAFRVGKHTLIPIEPFRQWVNDYGRLRVGIVSKESKVAELIDLMRAEGAPSALKKRKRTVSATVSR